MALSQKAQDLIKVAITDQSAAQELISAINAAEGMSPAAHVAPVSAADATDLTSAEDLANANKAAINSIIANMIASGQMSAS